MDGMVMGGSATGTADEVLADPDVITITVVDPEGVEHRLQGLDGWRVMEVIRDWGLPMKAECGGACACGTCHVYVDEAWLDRLIPAQVEEEEQLDVACHVESNSRLSCQILLRPDLAGLKVRIAPGCEE